MKMVLTANLVGKDYDMYRPEQIGYYLDSNGELRCDDAFTLVDEEYMRDTMIGHEHPLTNDKTYLGLNGEKVSPTRTMNTGAPGIYKSGSGIMSNVLLSTKEKNEILFHLDDIREALSGIEYFLSMDELPNIKRDSLDDGFDVSYKDGFEAATKLVKSTGKAVYFRYNGGIDLVMPFEWSMSKTVTYAKCHSIVKYSRVFKQMSLTVLVLGHTTPVLGGD